MTDVFVSAEWVAEHDDAVVVDVRDEWEYDGIGHVPGAVSIPFDAFRSDEGEMGKLPPREDWESLLSAAGVGVADHIVAYDDTHGVFAARFLVTALLLGHDPAKLHLLDGDFSSWRREQPTSSDTPDIDETDYRVDPPSETPLVSFEDVQAALSDVESGETVLVDTREGWEYEEGHIPGAVQFDWREVVDDESRGLRNETEIRERLEGRGIVPEKRVLLYCNTARRISHTYLVLKQLGYDDVQFYEGSLTEWEERGGEVAT